ncbi:phenylalanine--tRNA ligase subunit beta [archaeon]|nr:phenylalanine--tRNA ligase subunit beta [archaeon]
MPTIELNKELLLKHTGKLISDRQLAERIPMIGTFLEGITKENVKVEVFVNRPDMLSEEGFGRALSAFLGVNAGLREYRAASGGYECVVDPSVKDTDRPLTALAVLRGMSFDEAKILSAMQLQDKLAVTHGRKRKKAGIGVYDLSAVKWPVTYKALPRSILFTPMGENRKMTVEEALSKTQKGREYSPLVAGFKKLPGFVDASGKVLAILPVTQDESTKVTERTRDVMIEVSGNDWNSITKMLNILCANWSENGAKIYSVTVKRAGAGKTTVTPELKPEKHKLDPSYCNRLLGLQLTAAEVKKLLARMGHKAHKADGSGVLNVTVPCYRTDILHQMDLVEEVAIAYGYENFEPVPLETHGSGSKSKSTVAEETLAEICAGIGFQEVITLHLSNRKTLVEKMLLAGEKMLRAEEPPVSTLNSVNTEYDVCRNALLPTLLKALSENKHNEYPQKLFEIGAVFSKRNGIVEDQRLALLFSHKTACFSEAKAYAEAIVRALGLEPSVRAANHPSFVPGRCAKLVAAGKEIGTIGEIHPQVLNNFEVDMPASGMEISVEKLMGIAGKFMGILGQ